MTTNPPIETTPAKAGGNVAIGERQLGRQARACLDAIERLHGRHAEVIEAIHEKIIEFGRILLAGKEINPSTRDFNLWCERERITKEHHKFGDPVTRSQAMQIVRLHDDGIDPMQLDQDVEESDKVKLVLAGCTAITPAEILKWARRTQPKLFPDSAVRQAQQARRAAEKLRKPAPPKSGEEIADEDFDDVIAKRAMPDQVRSLVAEIRADDTGEDKVLAFVQSLYEEGGASIVQAIYDACERVLERADAPDVEDDAEDAR